MKHTLRTFSMARKSVSWNPQRKTNRGRPNNTRRRESETERNYMGMVWSELKDISRRGWHAFSNGLLYLWEGKYKDSLFMYTYLVYNE